MEKAEKALVLEQAGVALIWAGKLYIVLLDGRSTAVLDPDEARKLKKWLEKVLG